MTTTLALLAAIGAIEAAVFLIRYRTANDTRIWLGGLSTFGICSLRAVFVYAGVDAIMSGVPILWVLIAYAGTSAIVTVVIHALMVKHENRRFA